MWLQSSSKCWMTVNVADCWRKTVPCWDHKPRRRVYRIGSVSVSRWLLWYATTWVAVDESLPCWMQPSGRWDTTDIHYLECSASASQSWRWCGTRRAASATAAVLEMCDRRSRLSTSRAAAFCTRCRGARVDAGRPASTDYQFYWAAMSPAFASTQTKWSCTRESVVT